MCIAYPVAAASDAGLSLVLSGQVINGFNGDGFCHSAFPSPSAPISDYFLVLHTDIRLTEVKERDREAPRSRSA